MIDEDDEEVEGEVELDLSLELSEATGMQRLERTAQYGTLLYTTASYFAKYFISLHQSNYSFFAISPISGDIRDGDLYLYGYDSETAAKEIENYDKMKYLFDSHTMCSSITKEETNAYNDYIANNIDDNDGNYYDMDKLNNNNNGDINNDNASTNNNNEIRRSSIENKNTKTDNTQNTLYSPLITEVELYRSGDVPAMRYNNSHDWEIKMLLLPESPPDTPRF